MPKILGFGDKLRHLRRSRGLLQKDVADALDISLRAYSRYECHNIIPHNPELIVRMAELFNVDKSYLMLVAPVNIDAEMNQNIFQRSFDTEDEYEKAQILARDALMQLESLYEEGLLDDKIGEEIAMTFNQIYFRAKLKSYAKVRKTKIIDDT